MAFGLKRPAAGTSGDGRGVNRQRLHVPATILLATGDHREVMIENLSLTGFGAIGDVDLPVGTLFRIGLTPGHARHARVVWRDSGRLGCEFLSPLASDCPEIHLGADAG